MILRTSKTLRSGLAMVEAMISLAIASALLTAVGVAFSSSAQAVKINDEFFRATQASRVSLTRIMQQVRLGSVDELSTITSLHLITNGAPIPRDVTYTYDATSKELRMITNDDLTDAAYYVMARGVTQCKFIVDLGKDYNNTDCVSRVTMNVAVKKGNNEIFLSGSGAPRRNVVYK
jgi:type II secretory pathway pseudopilin PulG